MEKKASQEDVEKKIKENAAENYLEAGRSLNTILISSVVLILVAAFGLELPGQIISSAYILTILSFSSYGSAFSFTVFRKKFSCLIL